MKVLPLNQPFKYFFWSVGLFFFNIINAQTFTLRDSLQGGLRIERTCFDVQRYNLDIQVLPRTKKIEGNNEIIFKVVDNTSKIQIDLFENMKINSIEWNDRKLSYKREFDAKGVSVVDLETRLNSEELTKSLTEASNTDYVVDYATESVIFLPISGDSPQSKVTSLLP